MAASMPSRLSLITSLAPCRSRRLKLRRNSVQNGSAGLGWAGTINNEQAAVFETLNLEKLIGSSGS